MTKKRLRLLVTIDEETSQILDELYALTGRPKATMIGNFVKDIKPHLKMSIDLIKKIKANEMQMSDALYVLRTIDESLPDEIIKIRD